MILPFSTQINGKPTHFIEKIWDGLLTKTGSISSTDYTEFHESFVAKFGYDWSIINECPKITTIREDKHDRWKVGNKIHFTINNRTKNSFQFAPVSLVKGIQKIKIERVDYIDNSKVFIDDRQLTLNELKILARNDGFDSLISFWLFFNYSFVGKIIHWTDLKY